MKPILEFLMIFFKIETTKSNIFFAEHTHSFFFTTARETLSRSSIAPG